MATLDPRNLGDRLEATEALDVVAGPAHRAVTAALPPGPAKDALQGAWLGHPLHPMLTDLPIGFWTSAFVLDLVGGRRSRPVADAFVALGVLTALPTAASGLADWSDMEEPARRAGIVHAAANLTATALYTWSFLARRRGERLRGVALGLAGATAATVGGYLGGHLAFRSGATEDEDAAADRPAREARADSTRATARWPSPA